MKHRKQPKATASAVGRLGRFSQPVDQASTSPLAPAKKGREKYKIDTKIQNILPTSTSRQRQVLNQVKQRGKVVVEYRQIITEARISTYWGNGDRRD